MCSTEGESDDKWWNQVCPCFCLFCWHLYICIHLLVSTNI